MKYTKFQKKTLIFWTISPSNSSYTAFSLSENISASAEKLNFLGKYMVFDSMGYLPEGKVWQGQLIQLFKYQVDF